MIEIKNITPGPVQLIVKSFSDRRTHSKAFTTLNIPGLQVRRIEDERAIDIYIDRAKKANLITSKYVPDNEVKEK